MTLTEAILKRRSIKRYRTDVTLGDDQLRELFEAVRLAPSSANIQHWHFVVVREQSNKDRLMAAAYDQPQVGQCSAAVIVVADPEQWRQAVDYWHRSDVPEKVVESMAKNIPGGYEGEERFSRDEAIRSIGLAAMTLMLKATEMGIDSGPMIGFDPDAVAREFNIQPPRFPAMLIVLGKEDTQRTIWPRPWRRPVSDIVRLEAMDGEPLADQ
jgi:nitroreductase